MRNKNQRRQGDIFFQSVKKMPKNVKPYNSKILAYGETTGHSHRVISDHDVNKYESFVDENGNIFIKANEEISIGHDEHNTITLSAGETWCVSRQREYDPIQEINRQVAD